MIKMKEFYPEGYKNKPYKKRVYTPAFLADCIETEEVLEAVALLCDEEHNTMVDLGCMKGIIPRNEGAIGIAEGITRDIAVLSRVGKSVCFCVTDIKTNKNNEVYAVLSRCKAQQKFKNWFFENKTVGDIIPARVTHLEPFGAFCDIGCGIPALLPIDSISVSRITHPQDRFNTGNDIFVVIKNISSDGKITVSHKELLGTWQENANMFSWGQTVTGIIRSVEDYGVFVELTPNLAGLAEPNANARVGECASVYIKSILPEKMKIKLIIIDSFSEKPSKEPFYFKKEGRIDKFCYSPPCCQKKMETVFC